MYWCEKNKREMGLNVANSFEVLSTDVVNSAFTFLKAVRIFF